MELVKQIVPFNMTHNAEPEAVDLLLEVCVCACVLLHVLCALHMTHNAEPEAVDLLLEVGRCVCVYVNVCRCMSCVPFNMTHNAEPEAVDLLLEVGVCVCACVSLHVLCVCRRMVGKHD
jgi:hypothetical protein